MRWFLSHSPLGRGKVVLESKIKSGERSVSCWHVRNLATDRDVPLARSVARYGRYFGRSLIGAVVSHFDVAYPCEPNLPPTRKNAERSRLRVGKGAKAILSLETTIPTSGEEVLKRSIQPKKSILRHLRVYVCIAHKTLLEVRKRALLLVNRDGPLLCLVGISPLGERDVVEKP
jgi:hypothetical protein